MDSEVNSSDEVRRLREIIRQKDSELEELKKKLSEKTKPCNPDSVDCPTENSSFSRVTKLSNDDIARFSRQLILPDFGVKGQLAVQSTAVLVVGCGGLGCPVAIYLAAAGIGKLGLVDYDDVELSNLHRQVLHTEAKIGMSKSQSVAESCNNINRRTICIPHRIALSSDNALEIVKQYDIIVDATDNVATRYLLSDACVLASKPLVSGSALRFEGQLTVYNYKGSPCYRCLFPVPPPPETVTNCSDGGVLGPVVGVIGCMQALEVIKIAADIGSSYGQRMLIFDGLAGLFRSVKLRGRKVDCEACGESRTINKLIDYVQFCGTAATDKDRSLTVLKENERISVWDYNSLVEAEKPHLLIDVRQPIELDICQLPKTTHNIPIENFGYPSAVEDIRKEIESSQNIPVFVVCRRGNDSQLAVRKIQEACGELNVPVQDIKGGLHAWTRYIDKDFPIY